MTEVITKKVVANEGDLNRDPISGTTGSHPLGTSAGAASGGVAGAAVGLVMGGPIGGVIGAAVGAITGGLTGKSAAEAVNPTAEEEYWRETFIREPYYTAGKPFEFYAPAFRAGWEGRVRHHGQRFEAVESEMKAHYESTKAEHDPSWLDVRPAARAAWDRVDLYWKVGQ
jgi:hypothetical protein